MNALGIETCAHCGNPLPAERAANGSLSFPEAAPVSLLSRRLGALVLDLVAIDLVASPLAFAKLSTVTAQLVVAGVAFVYFTVCDYVAGGSAGKLVTGLRVRTTGQGRPPLLRSALRSALKLLTMTPLLLPACLIPLVRNDGRALHDFAAGTTVERVAEPNGSNSTNNG